MTSITLNSNEWSAVRTALRMLRNSPTLREAACESTAAGEATKPLTPSQIDDLCDRLYFCTTSFSFIGRGRPVDDAVVIANPARPIARVAG